MSGALDRIGYVTVPGTRPGPRLRLYSLSTCAFCNRAKSYLSDLGFEYQYVDMDLIDADLKRSAKAELKAAYYHVPAFPVLTIDDSYAISGFVEEKWSELLGISAGGI